MPAESLVHVCGADRNKGAEIVSAPAVAPCVMPPEPIVSELVLPPVPVLCISTVPVLLKVSPRADWGASRFTACDELRVVMLKIAVSAAPGLAAGLSNGLLEFDTLDHGPITFQLVPVPSQKMFSAKAASGVSNQPSARIRNSPQPSRIVERYMHCSLSTRR